MKKPVNNMLLTSAKKLLLHRQLVQARREVAKSLVINITSNKMKPINNTDRACEQIDIFQGKLNSMK